MKKWSFSTQTESNTSFSFNWITVSIVLAAGYLTSTCCPEVYAICCHSCYSMSIFNTFIWDVVLTPPRHCCIITTYITLGPPSPITSFITRTSVSSTTSVHTFSQTGNSHKVTCCFFAMFMADWELTVYDECQNSFDIVIELWHMKKQWVVMSRRGQHRSQMCQKPKKMNSPMTWSNIFALETPNERTCQHSNPTLVLEIYKPMILKYITTTKKTSIPINPSIKLLL